MSDDYPNIKIMTKVLNSPAYQEYCRRIFDIFSLSRKVGLDSYKVLDIQGELIKLTLHMQEERKRFEGENNFLGSLIAKRLLNTLKQVADSMAWRVLKFDRILIQLLSEHPETGYLDNTVIFDYVSAKRITEEQGRIVLINDLTTVLRHWDLTTVKEDILLFSETKYGEASRNNRRSKRQRRKTDEILNFLRKGFREQNGMYDLFFRSTVPIEAYHSVVEDALQKTRNVGVVQLFLSECLAIESTYSQVKTQLPEIHVFEGEDDRIELGNLDFFEKTISGIAPYGIYPFSDENCFALMTGEIQLRAILNLSNLRKVYARHNLILEFPELPDTNAFNSASIPQKREIIDSARFRIGYEDHFINITLYTLLRTVIEFISEDTIMLLNKQLLNRIIREKMDIPVDKITQFYVGHEDESCVWI